MKKLLTLLIIILSLTGHAQQRGATKIIVTHEHGFDDAYRIMGQTLAGNGFAIEHTDRDFGTITTRDKRIGRRLDPEWHLRISVVVSSSTVTITGDNRGPGGDWVPARMAGSVSMRSNVFLEMVEIAEALGGEIEYE